MPASDQGGLFAVTWRLIGIDEATAEPVEPPTGCYAMRFRQTTVHCNANDERGMAAISAADSTGSDSIVVIEGDQMRFGGWFNGLVGAYNPAPVSDRSDMPAGPLTIAEQRFVLSILDGTASWAVQDDALTVTKPGTGSLIFVAHPVR
jgi:hypothetical protein